MPYQDLFILSLKQIRKETLQPDALRGSSVWTEECDKNIFETAGVDAPDHTARVCNGDGAALFGYNDRHCITDFRNA